MIKNKRLITVSVFIIIVILLTGCGQKPKENANLNKDTLVIAQGADIKSLDPHATNDQPSSRVMRQIYDTLVETTVDMELVPGLAENWERIDEKTVKMKLREGVKFHNGEELKSRDVKFTLERMLISPEVSHIIEAIDSIKIIDDYNLIIKTKEPFGPLLAHLSHTAASILNEKAVKEAGESYGSNPVGTGPFKFINWKKGDEVTLERFEDYYEGMAGVEKVIFKNVPKGINRTIGLEENRFDIAYDVDQINKDRIIRNKNADLLEGPSLGMIYLGFNTQKKPYNDKNIRQAINYAIDVDEIINEVLKGIAQRANSPIGPRVFGYNPNVNTYDYNPDKAKRIIKQAGYEYGFNTTILINENPVRKQIAEIIQNHLSKVGVTVKIEVVDWATYLDKTANGEHEMFISGWISVTGDADYGLYGMFHSSDNGGESGNRFFYKNKQVDKLLEKGRKFITSKTRIEAYKEAQKLIVDDAPGVFLYYPTQNVAIQRYVKGFQLHPTGDHRLYDVGFKGY